MQTTELEQSWAEQVKMVLREDRKAISRLCFYGCVSLWWNEGNKMDDWLDSEFWIKMKGEKSTMEEISILAKGHIPLASFIGVSMPIMGDDEATGGKRQSRWWMRSPIILSLLWHRRLVIFPCSLFRKQEGHLWHFQQSELHPCFQNCVEGEMLPTFKTSGRTNGCICAGKTQMLFFSTVALPLVSISWRTSSAPVFSGWLNYNHQGWERSLQIHHPRLTMSKPFVNSGSDQYFNNIWLFLSRLLGSPGWFAGGCGQMKGKRQLD